MTDDTIVNTRILELETELAAAGEARAQARNEAYRAQQALETLKKGVRDAVQEVVDNGDLERSTANDLLEGLDLKRLAGKYTVTLTVLVTVEGVEADDEDDARQKVGDDYSVEVSCENDRVDHELQDSDAEEEN